MAATNQKAKVIDPEALLAQLSSEEKISLLSGDDMWHTLAIPRLGIPRVRVSAVMVGERSRADEWYSVVMDQCISSLIYRIDTDCRLEWGGGTACE